MIKIKVHSFVDVITNSSTTIYTYCDGCIAPAKELVRAFAETMGLEEDVDEMFSFVVMCDDDYVYYEAEDVDGKPEDEDEIKQILEAVKVGNLEKPEWMTSVEGSENYNGYTPSTDLCITPKDEKYKKLGEALLSFLNSTDADGGYDG